jgi:hypothetical protein
VQGGPDDSKADGGGNGNLKVVRGSHLFRDPTANAPNDDALRQGWMTDPVTGKTRLHPLTHEPLKIEELECPRGSVVLMWCAMHMEHRGILPAALLNYTSNDVVDNVLYVAQVGKGCS